MNFVRGLGWATVVTAVVYLAVIAVLYAAFRYTPLFLQWVALSFARIVS